MTIAAPSATLDTRAASSRPTRSSIAAAVSTAGWPRIEMARAVAIIGASYRCEQRDSSCERL
jgi:hypothetical protein